MSKALKIFIIAFIVLLVYDRSATTEHAVVSVVKQSQSYQAARGLSCIVQITDLETDSDSVHKILRNLSGVVFKTLAACCSSFMGTSMLHVKGLQALQHCPIFIVLHRLII